SGGIGPAAAFGSRKAACDSAAASATHRAAQTREPAPQRHDIAARTDAGVGRRNGAVVGKLVVPVLEEKWPDQAPTVDQERIQEFEAEYANQIWQSDVMYGPYVEREGGGKRQSFLCAVLDAA